MDDLTALSVAVYVDSFHLAGKNPVQHLDALNKCFKLAYETCVSEADFTAFDGLRGNERTGAGDER